MKFRKSYLAIFIVLGHFKDLPLKSEIVDEQLNRLGFHQHLTSLVIRAQMTQTRQQESDNFRTFIATWLLVLDLLLGTLWSVTFRFALYCRQSTCFEILSADKENTIITKKLTEVFFNVTITILSVCFCYTL